MKIILDYFLWCDKMFFFLQKMWVFLELFYVGLVFTYFPTVQCNARPPCRPQGREDEGA